nr:hypothetical protein BaRGS_006074 [Batillaria attramentaria]
MVSWAHTISAGLRTGVGFPDVCVCVRGARRAPAGSVFSSLSRRYSSEAMGIIHRGLCKFFFENFPPNENRFWSLMVFVRSKEEFRYYDSGSSNENKAVARNLMDRLQPYLQASKRGSKFIVMDCPHQNNGYDCGMYVICVAEHLCREFCECYNVQLMDVITETSVQQKRQQLLKLIFDLADQEQPVS